MTTNVRGVVAAKKYWQFVLTDMDGSESRSIKGPLTFDEARLMANSLTERCGYRSVVWGRA